ncbi:hypothetical protein ACFRAU_11630 [Arthrobacter sp. NPDC056691]|uniref:hypothetical protein n=1 Tax=Arthrobacter sp. NPDC056691 TaxID=3345913 RepID=UPI00366B7740
MTETEKGRKARRLAWTGVLLLFVGILLVPNHWGPAMVIDGAGIFALGTALRDTKQQGGRILQVVGAAIMIAGAVLTIMEVISFFQR